MMVDDWKYNITFSVTNWLRKRAPDAGFQSKQHPGARESLQDQRESCASPVADLMATLKSRYLKAERMNMSNSWMFGDLGIYSGRSWSGCLYLNAICASLPGSIKEFWYSQLLLLPSVLCELLKLWVWLLLWDVSTKKIKSPTLLSVTLPPRSVSQCLLHKVTCLAATLIDSKCSNARGVNTHKVS